MINNLNGDIVTMRTSDPRHYGFKPEVKGDTDFVSKFGQSVQTAFKDVNNMQVHSDKMSMQMMLQPESVNAHDVMIAAQKAQLSLDLTRTVMQKVVQAYQKITSLR